MRKIDFEKAKKIKVVVIATAVIIAFCVFIFTDKNESTFEPTEKTDSQNEENPYESDTSKAGIEAEAKSLDIIVDVSGAVVSPKVVRLKEGGRVYEAIEKAGGLIDAADTKYLNLAAKLQDGDKLYVPTLGEYEKKENNVNQSRMEPGISKGYQGFESEQGFKMNENSLININSATSEELQTLTGVGPSTAQKIMDYRDEQGSFKSIEDLKEVSGIGEKTFAKFQDKICVD